MKDNQIQRYRDVMTMRDTQGLTFAEIAQAFGVSDSRARQMYKLAPQKMAIKPKAVAVPRERCPCCGQLMPKETP